MNGELPSALGNLEVLEILDLSENDWYGNLPSTFNKLTRLKSLFIDAFTRNNAGISGSLLDFSGMPMLRNLYLGSNSLTGTIPKDLLMGVSNYDEVLTVGLSANQLTGIVPRELSRFERLNIDVTDNLIEEMDPQLCSMNMWMDGVVQEFGCSGVLCPVGTFNKNGRQTSLQNPCKKCDNSDVAQYMGSQFCQSQEKKFEKEILVEFYNLCGGQKWKNAEHWLDDGVDICHWHGISCREGRSIEAIELGANNLVGVPPSRLFDIVDLTWLWLYSNPIKFRFDGIQRAKQLSSLLLGSTGLTSLEGIGGATALVDLDIGFNRLQGSLTDEITELRSLQTLSANNNELAGPIPSFSGNPKLKKLRLGDNRFTGTMPSFETHADLIWVDLSQNRLTGTIPIKFLFLGKLDSQIFFDVSDNDLNGIVPPELARFDKMTLLLRDNQFEGMSNMLCDKGAWNGGDVGIHQCDGIMCPPKKYAPLVGRASKGSSCESCDQNDYFGASRCSGASTLSLSFLVATTVAFTVFML